MTKIVLDIILIILFVTIALLQVYVIRKIKQLKHYYKEFSKSEESFMKSIDKARQSLMLVNSQATDVLPELKLSIDRSEALMQDFSFVMARANRKLDQLQNASKEESITEASSSVLSNKVNANVANYQNNSKVEDSPKVGQIIKEETSKKPYEDPLLARLAKQEQENDFLMDEKNTRNKPNLSTQEELIEKALKEIL